MRNLYKQLDIFKCVHEAHKGFESRMSVHHILNKKQCYPHGCFYFKWHCKLFKQGKKCYRGYKHMGKNCFGCRHFYEEQIFNRAELQISEEAYRDFQKELELFEEWLEENLNREIEIHGKIDGVKPLFHKRIFHKGESLSFSGFLVIFKSLFFDRTLMEDHVYLRMSPKSYASLKFGRGDVLSGRATLKLDNGRLVLQRLRRIDIEERGETPLWNESKALVARETATLIPAQPDGCVQCPYGSLIDTEDMSNPETRKYRQLYCLQGMNDYRICPEYTLHAGFEEADHKTPANAASCMTRKVNVTLKM